MKLFRGRLGFPRWSFTDGISKPRRVAERDPDDIDIDDTDDETTQLPRFAIAHLSAGGARSAMTPNDPARRYGAAPEAASRRSYAAEDAAASGEPEAEQAGALPAITADEGEADEAAARRGLEPEDEVAEIVVVSPDLVVDVTGAPAAPVAIAEPSEDPDQADDTEADPDDTIEMPAADVETVDADPSDDQSPTEEPKTGAAEELSAETDDEETASTDEPDAETSADAAEVPTEEADRDDAGTETAADVTEPQSEAADLCPAVETGELAAAAETAPDETAPDQSDADVARPEKELAETADAPDSAEALDTETAETAEATTPGLAGADTEAGPETEPVEADTETAADIADLRSEVTDLDTETAPEHGTEQTDVELDAEIAPEKSEPQESVDNDLAGTDDGDIESADTDGHAAAGEATAAAEVDAEPADEPSPETTDDADHSPYIDDDQIDFIARQRAWMEQHGEWPTEPTEDAVRDAGSDHPDREYPERAYLGLPATPPAVVRAQNGRGFGGLSMPNRRRRRAKPRPPLDLDMLRLDEVMAETRESIGDALLDLTVFETKTGLPVASENGSVEATAMWHRAGKELTESLRYADLPRLGAYYLVRLTGDRVAVVVNAHEDLGACLTLDAAQVGLGTVLTQTVPAVRTAVASTVRGA